MPRIFRVSGIPRHWSPTDLQNALQAHGINPASKLRLLPSCHDPGTLTCVVAIDQKTEALAAVTQDPLKAATFPSNDATIVVDQHFHGMTALASPEAEDDIQAE